MLSGQSQHRGLSQSEALANSPQTNASTTKHAKTIAQARPPPSRGYGPLMPSSSPFQVSFRNF
jgi:hypothetical protein